MVYSRRLASPLDKEQVRGRIQAAALACFSERGLAGATMADIARTAGLSAASLYLHFASKQALFDSLARPDLDRPAARVVERRDQVLEAALEVFSHKGLAGTTMDEVAHAAGVSKAGLYGHFASKEELFAAVVHDERVLERLAGLWGELAASAKVARRRSEAEARAAVAHFLERSVRFYFEIHRDPKRLALMRIVLAEGARDPSVLVPVHQVREGGCQRVCSFLESMGFGRGEELRRSVEPLMGMMFSWIVMNRVLVPARPDTDAGRTSAELAAEEADAARRMVDVFLYGLGGRGERRPGRKQRGAR